MCNCTDYPSIPEPFVYIATVSVFLHMSSFSLLASSLVAQIWTLTLGIHKGGRINGSIVSICSIRTGNYCRAFSRMDWCPTFAILVFRAADIHSCIRWLADSDLIWLIARQIAGKFCITWIYSFHGSLSSVSRTNSLEQSWIGVLGVWGVIINVSYRSGITRLQGLPMADIS